MVSREEPGKQKTRSCRTQELAWSSAQENEVQKKGAHRYSVESGRWERLVASVGKRSKADAGKALSQARRAKRRESIVHQAYACW